MRGTSFTIKCWRHLKALFRVLLAAVDSEPIIGKLTGVHLGIGFTLVLIVHMCAATSA